MDEIKFRPDDTDEVKISVLTNVVNALIRDRNTGQGWETQVNIDRAEENIYNSLPVSVQAEMIEEEYNAALAEMEEI